MRSVQNFGILGKLLRAAKIALRAACGPGAACLRPLLYTIMHQSLTTYQISLKSKKLFVDGRTKGQTHGYTDVRTGGRTFETDCIRTVCMYVCMYCLDR